MPTDIHLPPKNWCFTPSHFEEGVFCRKTIKKQLGLGFELLF
ncbi:fibronectin [Bacillus toyonensis]|nr:fibronectin [Bacillus toyonensis]